MEQEWSSFVVQLCVLPVCLLLVELPPHWSQLGEWEWLSSCFCCLETSSLCRCNAWTHHHGSLVGPHQDREGFGLGESLSSCWGCPLWLRFWQDGWRPGPSSPLWPTNYYLHHQHLRRACFLHQSLCKSAVPHCLTNCLRKLDAIAKRRSSSPCSILPSLW